LKLAIFDSFFTSQHYTDPEMDQSPQPDKTIHWEKWTAVSTVVMALCALVTSVWQGYSFQQHNKLSLRPYLEFEANMDPAADGRTAFVLLVNNNGLGPAEVTQVDFAVAGQQPPTAHGIWPALGIDTARMCFGAGNVARFYKVGDRQMVIRAADEPCTLTQAEFDQLLKTLKITLHYKSLYGEEFVASWGNE
jgi:hypothetical protein